MQRFILIQRSEKHNHWASPPQPSKEALMENYRELILSHSEDYFYIAEEYARVRITLEEDVL